MMNSDGLDGHPNEQRPAARVSVVRAAGLYAIAGASAALVGDVVFEPWSAAVGVALGLIAWSLSRRQSPLWAVASGFGLWPAAMICWIALQIAGGGRVGLGVLLPAGTALGALLGAAGAALGRRWRAGNRVRLTALALAGGGAATAGFLFLAMTGPTDAAAAAAEKWRPFYRLPFPEGRTFLCIQGHRAVVSHRMPHEEFAFDFAMPIGAEVCAARGGTVALVSVGNDGNGFDRPNNFIAIAHGDDTFGWYLHLKQGGSRVTVGQPVRRGEVIGYCGNVGHSAMSHLHFHVADRQGKCVPIAFDDVAGDGIPRMFRRFTSGNRADGL